MFRGMRRGERSGLHLAFEPRFLALYGLVRAANAGNRLVGNDYFLLVLPHSGHRSGEARKS
jgi:hypothetical protein